jgi:hypothetical protein
MLTQRLDKKEFVVVFFCFAVADRRWLFKGGKQKNNFRPRVARFFLVPKIPKREIYTKLPRTIPNVHKI